MIQCVVVGIDHWDDLTRPFVEGLKENNKDMRLLVIDNYSNNKYPDFHGVDIWRMATRLGYGVALNVGAVPFGEKWDWLLCCNNDCICDGNVEDIIKKLPDDTIYGNAWKYDYSGMKNGLPAVVDSAYLLIPRRVWDKVGMFDSQMDAAFEEIDYQIRAIEAGFRVDILDLPITHLNLHTRMETEDYMKRWHLTEENFLKKYPGRKNG